MQEYVPASFMPIFLTTSGKDSFVFTLVVVSVKFTPSLNHVMLLSPAFIPL